MKYAWSFFLLCFSSLALAATPNVQRGGFGFLYPDRNTFQNPGQLAREGGFSGEIFWAKFSGSHEQAIVPSVAFSTGTFGFGAYASRWGQSLTDPNKHVQSYGGALGLSLANGRYTLGMNIGRGIENRQTSETELGTTVTLNPVGTTGTSVGLSVRTALEGPDKKTALRVAVGQTFQNPLSIEAIAQILDLSDFSNWEAGAFINSKFGSWYLSGGYKFAALNVDNQILIRLGIVIGKVDISGFATYIPEEGQNPFHGATLRYSL